MIAVGAVAVMLIFTFGFRVSGIEGTSMLPTLEDGDRVALTAFDGNPKRGQVIISVQPNAFDKPVVKRIIAPMSNEIITLVKDTSLARVIAISEILMTATEYTAEGLIWPLFYTGLYFLAFCGGLTLLFNFIEKKFDYYRS